MTVDLDNAEWQVVLGMIAQAPWRDANPLLMKIGEQLRGQQSPQVATAQPSQNWDKSQKRNRETNNAPHSIEK